jgi:hypothetical protein
MLATTPTNASPKLPTEATPAKSLPDHRTSKLPTAAQLCSADVPWLTLNDLFGEPELAGESANLYKSESLTQTTSQLAGKNLAPYSNQVAKYSLRKLLIVSRRFCYNQTKRLGECHGKKRLRSRD